MCIGDKSSTPRRRSINGTPCVHRRLAARFTEDRLFVFSLFSVGWRGDGEVERSRDGEVERWRGGEMERWRDGEMERNMQRRFGGKMER